MRVAGALAIAVLLFSTSLRAGAEGATCEEEGSPPASVERVLVEVRARELVLERRERELELRERGLADLESAVQARLDELALLRETVESRIAAWEQDHGDSVRRLAKIYAAMPARRAARLLEDLDLDLATQIVARMKHKQSAQLLAEIEPTRALAMSRQVAQPLRAAPARAAGARAR